MAYDYKASLKVWMSQHMLGVQDVRDILNEMLEDDRILPSTLVCSNGITSLAEDEANRTADGGGCYQMEDFGWAGDENLCGE